MNLFRQALTRALQLCGIVALVVLQPPLAQAQQPRPELLPFISLAEARAIDGAIAFARQSNMRAAVAVVDVSGNLVSADSMDGVRFNDMKGAQGKAFAAAIFRDTTEVLGELAKTRPDRYFGILSLYPGRVYLVGGGVPLAVEGRLVGGVGVAGLPQFVDEKAARAGMAAWDNFRSARK